MTTAPKLAATSPLATPTVEAQRDIALAVLVLVNDANLTSDEALDLLVEKRVISPRDREVSRSRYFDVLRHLDGFVDALKLELA